MTSPISIGQASLNTRPHALYRFYDASDVLLYVGITVDPGARFKKHASDKPWWGEVDRIGIERYATRKEALEAERKAIQEEQPLHNVVHNQFVESTGNGVTNESLACDLIFGYLGIDHQGDEHLELLAEARAKAKDDEREFGDPDAEVAMLLFSQMSDQLDIAQYRLYAIYEGVPYDDLERHREAAAETVEEAGFVRDRDDLVESEVARRIGSELAMFHLSQFSPADSAYIINLALPDGTRPTHWPTRALYYRECYMNGTLQKVLEKEGRA